MKILNQIFTNKELK